MRRLIFIIVLPLVFTACGNEQTGIDHPAYHNPLVQPCTDSIAAAPDDAGLYYRRAEALSEVGADSMALVDVTHALNLDRNNAQYLYTKGYFEGKLGHHEAAIQSLEQSLRYSPGNVSVRLLIGRNMLALKKNKEAGLEAEKILAAAPGHPAATMLLSAVLAAQKDTAGAMEKLRNLLQTQPYDYEASYNLAALMAAHNDPKAVQQFGYTFNIDTVDVQPLQDIGDYYLSHGNKAAAEAAYINCIKHDRNYGGAYVALGKIYLEDKKNDKALRHFNLAVANNPDDAVAYYWKGACMQQMQQTDSAKVAYRQALRLNGDLEEARAALSKMEK
ncbi:MAG: tetratricopeptide repeat protein [Edaphocola sp.]